MMKIGSYSLARQKEGVQGEGVLNSLARQKEGVQGEEKELRRQVRMIPQVHLCPLTVLTQRVTSLD